MARIRIDRCPKPFPGRFLIGWLVERYAGTTRFATGERASRLASNGSRMNQSSRTL
jgi:hypothetical protein